jgi:hypothetical protein
MEDNMKIYWEQRVEEHSFFTEYRQVCVIIIIIIIIINFVIGPMLLSPQSNELKWIEISIYSVAFCVN